MLHRGYWWCMCLEHPIHNEEDGYSCSLGLNGYKKEYPDVWLFVGACTGGMFCWPALHKNNSVMFSKQGWADDIFITILSGAEKC